MVARLVRRLEGDRELVEGLAEPVAGGDVGGDLVVAVAEVLDERVPGGDDPRGPVAFQAAPGESAGTGRLGGRNLPRRRRG
jgi:hypothetical protein